MNFEINHQENYSRSELLLRTFLGLFYIALPHAFLMFFAGIWSAIINFIAFWSILFTGRYPEKMYNFQVGLIAWAVRVQARMYNLADAYPAFGLKGTDEYTSFEMPYPEHISRGKTLLRTFFGIFYVMIPHGFILYLRFIAMAFLSMVAFWVVIFTGKYPAEWHKFIVDTLRWNVRVSLYISNMTDTYPPFSGKPDEEVDA